MTNEAQCVMQAISNRLSHIKYNEYKAAITELERYICVFSCNINKSNENRQVILYYAIKVGEI
jgi:hypothetical protein